VSHINIQQPKIMKNVKRPEVRACITFYAPCFVMKNSEDDRSRIPNQTSDLELKSKARV
jgi:hypothetical protein